MTTARTNSSKVGKCKILIFIFGPPPRSINNEFYNSEKKKTKEREEIWTKLEAMALANSKKVSNAPQTGDIGISNTGKRKKCLIICLLFISYNLGIDGAVEDGSKANTDVPESLDVLAKEIVSILN